VVPGNSVRILFWLLAFAPIVARGVEPLCLVPAEPDTRGAPERSDESSTSERIEITAGEVDLSGEDGVDFFGEVQFRYGERSISAESATYDRESRRVRVSGTVSYQDPDLTVYGEDAEVDTENEEITFVGAGFDIPQRPARGSAEAIRIRSDQTMSLTGVQFTTCPAEQTDWELMASDIDLDIDAGFGTARRVKIEFKGVPILYAPYLSFPIDERRKSGFLTPSFSERDRIGLDIAVPYYLNLAPNYDLTLEPRLMSMRGLQLNTEFRYLLESGEGQLDFDYLPNDSDVDITRHAFTLRHRTFFGEGWRMLTNIEDVSDAAYFEDLGDSQTLASQTHLDRYLDFNHRTLNSSLRIRLQGFQTIDTSIVDEDRPYRRVPQILYRGRWSGNLLRFESRNELVLFDRDVGVTGWRMDSIEEIGLDFERSGMFLRPAVALRQTNYWLDDIGTGQEDTFSRTLPVSSLDGGLIFERDPGETGRWIQTLEPRMLYVRVPFEDQSGLPVFDTIIPDFNLVQLFRKYQYVGADRVADSDQLSVGITTRLIDSDTGEERLAATLGQTRYLSDQSVALPGALPSTADASDYIAEVSATIADAWKVRMDYQWNSETNETARAEMSFQYAPEPGRLAGFSYRYRDGLLEQGDLSLVWPIGQSWRIIGRYSFSFLDDEPLDRFLGWEYEACCWRLRVIGRRYISRRSGESDSSISVQLQLKGFSDPGDPPELLLDRGILGYQRL
jgi:LPS-assembly protein